MLIDHSTTNNIFMSCNSWTIDVKIVQHQKKRKKKGTKIYIGIFPNKVSFSTKLLLLRLSLKKSRRLSSLGVAAHFQLLKPARPLQPEWAWSGSVVYIMFHYVRLELDLVNCMRHFSRWKSCDRVSCILIFVSWLMNYKRLGPHFQKFLNFDAHWHT